MLSNIDIIKTQLITFRFFYYIKIKACQGKFIKENIFLNVHIDVNSKQT